MLKSQSILARLGLETFLAYLCWYSLAPSPFGLLHTGGTWQFISGYCFNKIHNRKNVPPTTTNSEITTTQVEIESCSAGEQQGNASACELLYYEKLTGWNRVNTLERFRYADIM